MAYDLIKISALPAATPDESQEIVVGVGDLAKRINYGAVKADMVGTSPSYTIDTEPYLMRQTAHTGVVGKCALNKLVGGSIGWNQLVANGNFESTSSWTARQSTISVANNIATVIPSSNGTERGLQSANYLKVTAGHKYIIKVDINSPITSYVNLSFGGTNAIARAVTASAWVAASCVYEASVTATTALYALIAGTTTTSQTIQYRNAMSTDLTLDFGSTIADYVYGLEQATAGSGVAWLSKYIDFGTYHAYDAGSIQSVQATAHVTTDADDNVIGNYPLGSDTLRGIPQLVNGELAYDGDVKTPDGTITRNYKIVDLGALNWSYSTSDLRFVTTSLSDIKAVTNIDIVAKLICARYTTSAYQYVDGRYETDKIIGLFSSGSTNYLAVKDTAYSTAAAFKTAVTGQYMVYELQTPSTESSTAFQKVQTIDADGTESFTVSSPVPVGHETQTPDNILAALGWLGE